MKSHILEIFRYRELLGNLVSNELKLRYRNSVLGFLWTILNPLFFLLILALVFSQIMKFQIENYHIFILSGLTAWLMIQQTVVIATASIVNNQDLIKKVYIPKILFPLSSVLARYVDHLILTAILFGLMIIFHMPLTWNLLFLPVILLLHFLFSLGFSLIAAVFYIKVRDVQHIIAIIFQVFFYLTPIIYTVNVFPQQYRKFFLLNPFYYFIQSFRFPVYYSQFPPWWILGITLGITVFTLVAGVFIFFRNEKYFVFHLS